METNNNKENPVADQKKISAAASTLPPEIKRIEQQFSRQFRELLLSTLRDRKVGLDIYEFNGNEYILNCEYKVQKDEDAITPSYFVKGLAYTDGEVERKIIKNAGSDKKLASPSRQIIIKNPSIVAIMEWRMGELYSRRTGKLLKQFAELNPALPPVASRFTHNLNLSIFCRDKTPVSEYAGHLILERLKRK